MSAAREVLRVNAARVSPQLNETKAIEPGPAAFRVSRFTFNVSRRIAHTGDEYSQVRRPSQPHLAARLCSVVAMLLALVFLTGARAQAQVKKPSRKRQTAPARPANMISDTAMRRKCVHGLRFSKFIVAPCQD